jgi:long-chain acyl-CoA synthetase
MNQEPNRTLVEQNRTLENLFSLSTRDFEDLPALTFVEKKPLTYKQVKATTLSISAFLFSKGLKKGDKVALLSQNMPNWGITYFATTIGGMVTVPILVDFLANDIKKILEHSEAKAIFVSDRLSEKILGNLPEEVSIVVRIDDFEILEPAKLKPTGEYATIPVLPTFTFTKPTEDDLAAILYTSGTTGMPKGVMLTHKNLVHNTLGSYDIQPITKTDRLLSVLPLAHTYECTIGFLIPFYGGATIYYLEKPPTASVLLPALQLVKPTIMLTVPLIIEKIFNQQVLPKFTKNGIIKGIYSFPPTRKLLHKVAVKKLKKTFGGCIKFFGIGGAKLSYFTERFLREGGFPYAIGYGLTETAPLLAGSPPSKTRMQTTGYCVNNTQLKLINIDPHTGEGEIVAKGDNVMAGYYKNPELTATVFTEDGWFKTGDLGAFDKDHYLSIRGRIKNIIVGPSGENIYPEEIEEIINKQSFVLESLVYEISGKIAAKVHLNYEELEKKLEHLKQSAKDLQVDAQEYIDKHLAEIKESVNAQLNKFSRISTIIFHKEPFEKTPTQKIKRYKHQG